MGNTISGIIKGLDKADEKQAEAKEALQIMHQMADDILMHFYDNIENDAKDLKLIPIKRVLDHYQYIRCMTTNEEDISVIIKDSIKDFSSGDTATAVGNLAASVIHRLLGSSSGKREVETRYTISVDPLGGISRLDTLFFVYSFQSEGIMKLSQSVVAACVVKSSADTSAVDENTLRVLINQAFESSALELQVSIFEQISKTLFKDVAVPVLKPPPPA